MERIHQSYKPNLTTRRTKQPDGNAQNHKNNIQTQKPIPNYANNKKLNNTRRSYRRTIRTNNQKVPIRQIRKRSRITTNNSLPARNDPHKRHNRIPSIESGPKKNHGLRLHTNDSTTIQKI